MNEVFIVSLKSTTSVTVAGAGENTEPSIDEDTIVGETLSV